MRGTRADTILLVLLVALVIGGALVFTSAALGLLARGATNISSVVFNHFVLGIGMGLVLLVIGFTVDYRKWRPFAPYIFGTALIATALVFIPGLGFEHGGGRRWIDLRFMTLQPSEFLKIGVIFAAAAYFSLLRDKTASWRGPVAFLGILAIPGIILLIQPDLGTLGIISIAVFAIFVAVGESIRDIALIMAAAIIAHGLLWFRPHYS